MGRPLQNDRQSFPERFKDQVPDDIAAAREISKIYTKFGLAVLIDCFEKIWITNRSTRREIDALYTRLGARRPAPRNP